MKCLTVIFVGKEPKFTRKILIFFRKISPSEIPGHVLKQEEMTMPVENTIQRNTGNQ